MWKRGPSCSHHHATSCMTHIVCRTLHPWDGFNFRRGCSPERGRCFRRAPRRTLELPQTEATLLWVVAAVAAIDSLWAELRTLRTSLKGEQPRKLPIGSNPRFRHSHRYQPSHTRITLDGPLLTILCIMILDPEPSIAPGRVTHAPPLPLSSDLSLSGCVAAGGVYNSQRLSVRLNVSSFE